MAAHRGTETENPGAECDGPLLYNQPLAVRFGNELKAQLDPFWDQIDIAVAWVRESGVAHLHERLASFLRHGGQLCFVVGIDLQNTTREGLARLLELEDLGQAETFVYHNEAGTIFHPKLYLFRNEDEARLVVGSNNLTESGLYTNVEASLQVDVDVDADVVATTLDALASWKDTESQLAARLDREFLQRLTESGYLPTEAEARKSLQRERIPPNGRKPERLFGSRRFQAPARDADMAGGGAVAGARAEPQGQLARENKTRRIAEGTALLMRLRKAHAKDRPTQTQIPFRVVDTFFRGAREVRSAHSGERHAIIQATARGGRNTVKLEIPEMRAFEQPLARFERIGDDIVYEVYDLGTPKGNQILGSLMEGRKDDRTQMTIRDPEHATWWRFI